MQFPSSALLVALFCTVTIAAPVPQVGNFGNIGGGNVVLNGAQIDALDAIGQGTVIAPGQAAIAQGVNAQLLGAQSGENDQEAQLAALATQISAVNTNFGVANQAAQQGLFDSLNKE